MCAYKKINTWFVLSRQEHCPPDTDIVLGSIITDPLDPRNALNNRNVLYPSADLLRRLVSKRIMSGQLSRERGGRVGILARFLSPLGAGVDVDFGHSSSRQLHFVCENVESVEFSPDPQYLEQAMQHEAVYTEAKKIFSPNLYMVTAVTTATKARVFHANTSTTNLKTDVAISVFPGMGDAGPKFGIDSKDSYEIEWEVDEPFVFSYRLNAIQYSVRRAPKAVAYTAGAAYGLSDQFGEEHKESVLQVAGLDEDDVSAEDVNIESMAAVDAADNECECVSANI